MAMGLASTAAAQNKFPSRPIRIVSPFAAGAVSDVSLRLVADRLAARLGGQVIVENQPRAGGVTAALAVLQAAPDGHTIALLSNSTAISVSLFKQLPYDPQRDFVPVVSISNFANVIATGAQSPYRTLGDVMAAARANPGVLNVGTSIVGSSNHLTAVLFKSRTGLDIVIVPYRGPGDLLTGALRNDASMIVQSFGALKGPIESGQLRMLASTTAKRAPYAPDVPTVQEAGVADFEVVSWNGLFVPAGTPREVIARLNREVSAILEEAEIRRRFLDLGLDPLPSSPDELGGRMTREIARWARVIAEAGIEKQ
jgi:tripartite-type tricarboxylate transporter receptor subunit TctC